MTINTLRQLYDKWGKAYLEEAFRINKMKRKPRYDLFCKIAKQMFGEILDKAISDTQDTQTVIGTFMARSVRYGAFRNKRYGRNFTIIGGREYTIFDLMKKDNQYPVFTFRNNGWVISRTVMWRCYVRPSVKWRHKLYQKFYDEGVEYKIMRYPNKEQAKIKRVRKIWRNNQLLHV